MSNHNLQSIYDLLGDFLADSRPDDMSPEDFYALLARAIERDREVEAMRLYGEIARGGERLA